MTIAASPSEPVATAGPTGRSLHVLLGLVLVAGYVLLGGPSASFTSDDGAYAYQVSELLDGGGWVVEDPVPGLDTTTRPLTNSVDTADGQIPYGRHPAVIYVALAVASILGLAAGLWFLPVVGLVAAALAGHRLAERLHPGSGPFGFWLVLAGPLLVNGSSFWAHAPSAAAAAWLMVAGLEVIDEGPSTRRLTLVALLAAVLPLLRSEGLLFAIALVLAVLVLGRGRGVLLAAITAAATFSARVIELLWVAQLSGATENIAVRGGSTDLVAGRVEGSWHSLLDPSFVDSPSGILLLVSLLLVAVAVTRVRAHRLAEGRWLLLGAAVVWLVWALAGARDLVPGLLVAWPALLLGAAVTVPRTRSDHLVGLVAVLFGASVIATQYADGGGAQWGGRFFSPLFVLVAALVAPAVAVLFARADLRWAVVAIVVVPVLAGGVATGRFRSLHDEVVAEATASGAPIVITEVRALPRLAWRAHPDTRWLLIGPAGLDSTIDEVQAAGYGEIAVHGFVDTPLAGDVEQVSPALRVVRAT